VTRGARSEGIVATSRAWTKATEGRPSKDVAAFSVSGEVAWPAGYFVSASLCMLEAIVVKAFSSSVPVDA
jgi:hypothetical protein